MSALYDTIGVDYSALRRPDPRIAAAIHAHLEDAASILNVGAGAGSYEPTHLKITAVEPSAAMIRQRPESDAVVVQATAEELPFEDKSFDASMAILTVHHWSDVPKGLQEMRRVLRPGGYAFLFVPAFMFLWGVQDDISHHRRRYTLKGLQQTARQAGFEIERATYANITFFLPVLLGRLLMSASRPWISGAATPSSSSRSPSSPR
jgi:SAM-dependent methyltransferase